MSTYIDLGLPSEEVINLATAYAGYARAIELENQDRHTAWIASSFLISASFFLLFDPVTARQTFFEAAIRYLKLRNSFWQVCGICADNFQGILAAPIEKIYPPDSSSNGFYDMLTAFYKADSYFEWPARRFRGKLPNSDITYQLVLDTIAESNEWVDSSLSDKAYLLNKFSELLRRAYEPTALSQSDSYHWNKLKGTVLPFDPQSLALTVLFTKKWNRNHRFSDLVELVEANRGQKQLLFAANGMISGEEDRLLAR